jgi:hypothetical protein
MEIREAYSDELEKILEVMIGSGEWDDWKLSYLSEDWSSMLQNLRTVINNKELGFSYVLEEKENIVGAILLIRIGRKALFFTCAGILHGYEEAAMKKIDEELFNLLPSQYTILMNYTRPTSSGVVPRFLKELGIKNAKKMYEKMNELPEIVKNSIKISPIYCYMEKKIEPINLWGDVNEVYEEECLSDEIKCCIKQYMMNEFIDAFDIFERDKIEGIYTSYGLKCDLKLLGKRESCGILINYPFGLTPSGYLNSAYLMGRNPREILRRTEKYCLLNQKRILLFVPENMRRFFEEMGYQLVKPLHQIFYDIEKNREWRSKYRELL